MVMLTPLHSVLDRMISISRAMDGAADSDWRRASTQNGTVHSAAWFPALDTFETEGAFVIAVDLPGVNQEELEINFEQNTLTISGTRKSETADSVEKADLRLFSSERAFGAFARSIRLPEYVDGEKIEARYDKGVLTVTVPKSAAAKPRKISIKAA